MNDMMQYSYHEEHRTTDNMQYSIDQASQNRYAPVTEEKELKSWRGGAGLLERLAALPSLAPPPPWTSDVDDIDLANGSLGGLALRGIFWKPPTVVVKTKSGGRRDQSQQRQQHQQHRTYIHVSKTN